LAKEKPPIFGMIQRGGQVVIRMLADVKRATIGPPIRQVIAPGAVVDTDESDIHARLPQWGYTHRTVCHAGGEFARDDDGERSMSTRRKASGRCRGVGFARIGGSRKSGCRCTWGSSSSCPTSGGGVRLYWGR
jgi:transposase